MDTKKSRYGLVMEGGAMRGMFTAGVNDVLLEHGIVFDGAMGVSAGATFGCNYKSRQIGRAIRYNLKYARDPRYSSIRSLVTTGDYYGAEFCYRTLPEQLDPFDVETYQKNPMRFYVVATSCETGTPVYHECPLGCGEDLDWFRASASMPLFARPVMIQGQAYLDGGISDSIPLERFQQMGYQRNLVILTRPSSYRKKPLPRVDALKPLFRKYPAVLEAMKQRPEQYNAAISYVHLQEALGNVLVLQPVQDLPIDRLAHDPFKLKLTYALGREEAERRLPEILEFLEQTP